MTFFLQDDAAPLHSSSILSLTVPAIYASASKVLGQCSRKLCETLALFHLQVFGRLDFNYRLISLLS